MTQIANVHAPTRKEWVASAKTSIEDWDRALDELEAKVAASKQEIRGDLKARLTALRSKAADARSRLSAIAEDAESVADNVGDEMSTAWEANKTAIERSLVEIRSALS